MDGSGNAFRALAVGVSPLLPTSRRKYRAWSLEPRYRDCGRSSTCRHRQRPVACPGGACRHSRRRRRAAVHGRALRIGMARPRSLRRRDYAVTRGRWRAPERARAATPTPPKRLSDRRWPQVEIPGQVWANRWSGLSRRQHRAVDEQPASTSRSSTRRCAGERRSALRRRPASQVQSPTLLRHAWRDVVTLIDHQQRVVRDAAVRCSAEATGLRPAQLAISVKNSATTATAVLAGAISQGDPRAGTCRRCAARTRRRPAT